MEREKKEREEKNYQDTLLLSKREGGRKLDAAG